MLRPHLTTVELEKSLLREKSLLLTDVVLTVAKTQQTLQDSTVKCTITVSHSQNHSQSKYVSVTGTITVCHSQNYSHARSQSLSVKDNHCHSQSKSQS